MSFMHSRRGRERFAFRRGLPIAAALVGGASLAAAQEATPASSGSQQASDEFTRALDQAVADQPKGESTTATPVVNLFGGTQLKLLDLSLDVLTSVGTSTEQNPEILNLQLGDHDPNRRGFRLNQAELSLVGAVDPYLNAEAHLVYTIDPEEGETGVELEEAFFTTQQLPWSLQLKGGMLFTQFGRINSIHPHAWDFVDQPVIVGRVFGGDGMRGPGAQLSWLAPLPWFTELIVGAQNGDGEQMASFLGNSETSLPGGHVTTDPEITSLDDFAWSARVLQSWDVRDDVVTQLGFSGAFGRNSAGQSTHTSVYGADFKVKWQPPKNDAGWPFVIWQSEAIHRVYGTTFQSVDPDGVPASGDEFNVSGDTLLDDGLYTYLLWGFERDWIAGLRYEYAASRGDGATPTDDDPLRDDRTRISPMLIWQPTHFSRVSLQYNWDAADHLQDNTASSVWLRLEFLIGRHPAHTY